MTLTILCAPISVPDVFDEAWAEAVVPFQLLAAMTILVSFMGPLTVAVGRANWEFLWSVGTMIGSLVAFLIGRRWGIVGVAASYLIIISLQVPIRFVITGR
jgi:O-antigen/teichoic acid export membrane protein